MRTKVKPVQPTVIKDKKIIEQVIREIRRKPSSQAITRMEEEDEAFRKLMRK